jgi:predicted dehydrogenase
MKILIIGLGSIGTRHLKLTRELMASAEIKVLRHKKSNAVPDFSDGLVASLDEAIAFAPHIAVVASPATSHIEIARVLAMAGAHILVEKPLSNTSAGVAELIEICKQERISLMVGYNLRFSPSLQRFREVLEQGIIGRVLSVRCDVGQYLPSWRPESDYRQGVSAKEALGGGVLLELSHELDYLRWIFGEVEWVRATLSRQSNLDIDVEDSAHLILGFSSKDDRQQLMGVVNLDFIRHDYTRLCTAIGESGTLRWNGKTGEVEIFVEDAPEWKVVFTHQPQRDETYVAEWEHFLDCIKENKFPTVTGEDGLKVIEIIEAVHKSAASGNQVAVVSCTGMETSFK